MKMSKNLCRKKIIERRVVLISMHRDDYLLFSFGKAKINEKYMRMLIKWESVDDVHGVTWSARNHFLFPMSNERPLSSSSALISLLSKRWLRTTIRFCKLSAEVDFGRRSEPVLKRMRTCWKRLSSLTKHLMNAQMLACARWIRRFNRLWNPKEISRQTSFEVTEYITFTYVVRLVFITMNIPHW